MENKEFKTLSDKMHGAYYHNCTCDEEYDEEYDEGCLNCARREVKEFIKILEESSENGMVLLSTIKHYAGKELI